MQEFWSGDQTFVCRIEKVFIDQWTVCKWKKYVLIEKNIWAAHQKTVRRLRNYSLCRLRNYLYIEELSADQRSICKSEFDCSSKKYSINRSKNYLQIEELSTDGRTAQIDEISANWRSIWSAEWRIICKLCKYSVFRSKNYLQIKDLSADPRTMGRLKFDQQIEEIFHLKIKW